MSYCKKSFVIEKPERVIYFLMRNLNISIQEASKMVDKNRVVLNGKTTSTKKPVSGKIEVIVYEPKDLDLMPIFETDSFAVFEKPSGMLVHPNGFDSKNTLIDSAKVLFGKSAQIVHRLDRSTSGLVIVAKNSKSDSELKDLFASGVVKKEYLLYAKGLVKKERLIDAPILAGNYELNHRLGLPKVMGRVSSSGKPSRTMVYPIRYIKEHNCTLIRAVPATGRTHQIRIHLAHIGHAILGDCLYGAGVDVAHSCLDRVLKGDERVKKCGANRVMLHASALSFFYQSNYFIVSKTPFGSDEMLQASKG